MTKKCQNKLKPKIVIYGPIQLGNIAYIVSQIMNHQYAKFHVFIKKLTINVIWCWLYRYIMCCKLALPHFQSVEHRSPCVWRPHLHRLLIISLTKRYESTEVDRRIWLHVFSGTHGSTSSDTHQVVEIQIETSTKKYTPFLVGLY